MRKLFTVRKIFAITAALLLAVTVWAGPKITQEQPYAPGAVVVTGGTINATPIGGTTPAAVYATPAINKGPAIITTFAGTISSAGEASSTTLNFTSTADAILAGYNATNPVLGTTLIAGGSTRYIVSWTDADTCVVDSVVTLALLTAITSVQLPIATFVNSAGVTQGWMLANGRVYFVQRVGIGTTAPSQLLHLKSASPSIRLEDSDVANSAAYFGYDGGFINISSSIGSTGLKVRISESAPDYSLYIAATTGNVGIGTTAPATKLDVPGSFQVSSAVALTLGGYIRSFKEATGTPAAASTTFDIAVGVPAGAKLLGAQLRVDAELTAGEEWGAAYIGGSTTAIAAAGQVVTKNLKVNKMHVDEITSNTTNIRITSDSGNFTEATGVIRAVVYYETFSVMGTAS